MSWVVLLDSSIPSDFIRYVIKVTNFSVTESDGSISEMERPALINGDKTIVGAREVAKVLTGERSDLATEEALKFVDYVLVDIVQAVSGELKMGFSVLHKLNKNVLNVTYMVNNHLTVADLCLFSALEPSIRTGKLNGVFLNNVYRWMDLIQHTLKKNFVPDFQILSFPTKVENKQQETKKNQQADKISKIDFRVAKIVDIQLHPNAESLYIEKVYLGESGGYRTIVSGLVKHIPIEELRDRLIVIVANLKPAKIRDVTSYGMLLAASNEDETVIEIVQPPPNSILGERVTIQDYQHNSECQPEISNKIFKSIVPLLSTNDQLIACYDQKPLLTLAGPCFVSSLVNATLS